MLRRRSSEPKGHSLNPILACKAICECRVVQSFFPSVFNKTGFVLYNVHTLRKKKKLQSTWLSVVWWPRGKAFVL